MTKEEFLLLNGEGGSSSSSWDPQVLRKIRGSMFTVPGNVPYGPVISFPGGVMGDYDDATYNDCISRYLDRGYTHAPMGAYVLYPYHDSTPRHTLEDFLRNHDYIAERIERALDRGITGIHFLSPDNWTLEQMKVFEPVFTSDRWQRIVRMVVPKGYEPSIDTPNSNYVAFLSWAQGIFPKALRYIHMVSNFDAPGNNDDLTPGTPSYIGNEGCWHRVAPYLHGWLVQNGPFMKPEDTPLDFKNFGDQFRSDVHGSLRQRFDSGYAGWPTHSAWGPNEGLDLIAGEYCSFSSWWWGLAESDAQRWGDNALNNQADGAFDGFHR